jgi:predicted membrane chloride channel (bestrophin family)
VGQALSTILQAVDADSIVKTRIDRLISTYTYEFGGCNRIYNTAIPSAYTRYVACDFRPFVMVSVQVNTNASRSSSSSPGIRSRAASCPYSVLLTFTKVEEHTKRGGKLRRSVHDWLSMCASNITQLVFADLVAACATPTVRRHTSRFLLCYIHCIPLLLWPLAEWGSPVLAVMISFLVLGIEGISSYIEEPFHVSYGPTCHLLSW